MMPFFVLIKTPIVLIKNSYLNNNFVTRPLIKQNFLFYI